MRTLPSEPGHQTAVEKAREQFFFGVDQERLRATFDPSFPHSYCRICGWLYQPPSQRRVVKRSEKAPGYAPNDSPKKQQQRRVAVSRHNNLHTPAEVFRLSTFEGNFVTPEAAENLGKFGLRFPIAGKSSKPPANPIKNQETLWLPPSRDQESA